MSAAGARSGQTDRRTEPPADGCLRQEKQAPARADGGAGAGPWRAGRRARRAGASTDGIAAAESNKLFKIT